MTSCTANELSRLLQQPGGVFVSTPCYHSNSDQPRVSLRFVRAGDISRLLPELAQRGSGAVQGSGTGFKDDDAWIPAIAEGVERYSAAIYRHGQFITAAANELRQGAMDLHTIPCCSRDELAHPKCPLVRPDAGKPIRWVRALSLLDGKISYVPVVMVFSRAGYANPAERFWLSTSTGCAAHQSYEQAVMGAIFEIVERDLVSITWLQRLALPRIELDLLPPELEAYMQEMDGTLGEIEFHFFDGTTSLGVPTVYAVQVAKHNQRVHTLIACSSALSAPVAIAKTVRDLAHLRFALSSSPKLTEDYHDFTDPLQGAAYMARAERAGEFEFLLSHTRRRKLSEIPGLGNPGEGLRYILEQLRRRSLQTYVIDLSTDEAIRSGMRVVRVLIPGLQPLSFRPRARFLGHTRLYSAPAEMGRPTLAEVDLNPWPQPFA